MNVQILTDAYTQRNTKLNRNNCRQKHFGDDVNPKRLKPDMSFNLNFGRQVLEQYPPKILNNVMDKILKLKYGYVWKSKYIISKYNI